MKTWQKVVLAAVAVASANAQSSAPKMLGDGYAKAALMALLQIRSDPSTAVFHEGDVLVRQHTEDRIDAADAEARNAQEVAMTDELRHLYDLRLADNLEKSYASTTDSLSYLSRGIVELGKAEDGCFNALEVNLRSRSSRVPFECTDAIRMKQERLAQQKREPLAMPKPMKAR